MRADHLLLLQLELRHWAAMRLDSVVGLESSVVRLVADAIAFAAAVHPYREQKEPASKPERL